MRAMLRGKIAGIPVWLIVVVVVIIGVWWV